MMPPKAGICSRQCLPFMALSTTTMLIQVIIGLICLSSLIEANTNMTALAETGLQKHLSQAATGLVALANQTNSTATQLANINNKLATTAPAKELSSQTKEINKSHLSSLVVSPKLKKSSESLTEAASEMMGDLSPAADHKKKKYILVKKKPKKKKPKKIKIKSYVKKYKTKYKKVKVPYKKVTYKKKKTKGYLVKHHDHHHKHKH